MFGGGFARGVLLRGGARRRQRAELLGELLRWQRAAQRPAGETTNRSHQMQETNMIYDI